MSSFLIANMKLLHFTFCEFFVWPQSVLLNDFLSGKGAFQNYQINTKRREWFGLSERDMDLLKSCKEWMHMHECIRIFSVFVHVL